MFGLMRARSCGVAPNLRQERRKLYCGTCKTLGRLYGQSTRLLLNHDAVFLGELLTALAPPTDWAPAYTPRRCAALPRASEVPLPLAYAATANIVLAEFKVADKIADLSRLWHTARLALSRPFQKARQRLTTWRFPLDTLFTQLAEQARRERAPQGTGEQALDYLAEPTATATRLVFEHSAQVIGTPEQAATLAELGDAFGRLVYVLDAVQDRTDDEKSGAFNALAATQTEPSEARRYLIALQQRMIAALQALPLSPEQRAVFTARLRSNVARALGTALPIAVLTQDGGPSPVTTTRRRRERGESNCDCDCCDACDCCFCCDGGCNCHGCDCSHGCDCCSSCNCCGDSCDCNCCDSCDCNCNC